MAYSTQMISSEEQNFSEGLALRGRSYAHITRQDQISDQGINFESRVRTCDCASNSSGECFSTIRHADQRAEPSSVCLMAMVDEYIELEDSERSQGYCHRQSTFLSEFDAALSCQCSVSRNAIQELDSILRSAVTDQRLAAHIQRAADEYDISAGYKQQEATSREVLLRLFVLKSLKRMGYNAGICKSERETISGFPLDEHEYMDVIFDNSNLGRSERVFVDLRFRSQFKIARPSSAYRDLRQMLPKIFVGDAFTLQRIVRLMSHAAKASLESQGMHVPPWRRMSFMHAKWFSPYARTTDSADFSKICSKINMSGAGAASKESDQKRVLKDWNSASNASKSSSSKQQQQQQQLPAGSHNVLQQHDGSSSKARSAVATLMSRDWQPPPPSSKPSSSSAARKIQRNVAGALALAMVDTGLNVTTTPKRSTSMPLQRDQHAATVDCVQ